MRITKISVRNFRILQDSTLDFDRELCLLLGRNNTGKTSFMVLIEKFLKTGDFNFNDFSLNLRKKLFAFDETTDVNELAIQLIMTVEYDEKDNLCHLSEFILDLDPQCKTVNLLFERSIKKDKMLEGIKTRGKMPLDKYVTNHIKDCLERKVYTFNSIDDLKTENRYKLIEKELKDVEKLIDFEIIHAKRSVASSEEKNGAKVLSKLTTDYFNHANINAPDKFESINDLISKMDEELGGSYETFFNSFLANAKEFLSMGNLRVVSNLKAKEIVKDSSEVVYGDLTQRLPEHLNGLGHMNILFLLLSIEIKKEAFKSNNKDIKLLLIEEPEAHTHPQIQYIFAQKIEDILYLYGEEVKRDYEKAIAYLTASAEHGNQYAKQLLYSVKSKRNWSATIGSLHLLCQISRIIQNQLENEYKGKQVSIDRKLRRIIKDKKQAHGLKQ